MRPYPLSAETDCHCCAAPPSVFVNPACLPPCYPCLPLVLAAKPLHPHGRVTGKLRYTVPVHTTHSVP